MEDSGWCGGGKNDHSDDEEEEEEDFRSASTSRNGASTGDGSSVQSVLS